MEQPEKIGKYEVVRQIGEGTMGVVFEAYDPFVQRTVAIKVAAPENFDANMSTDEYLATFFSEVHTAGSMHHPQVISVFDAGTDGDLAYIVMEYIKGETLEEYISGDKTMTVEKVVDVIFQCCKGLEYVHKQGVIHRDLKPANIMITAEGDVKLMDFSIAHANVETEGARVVEIKGSPMYMPPEQVQLERRLVPQSDLYSIGAVMYELLARRPMFRASSIDALIYQIINIEPDSLSDIRPDVPFDVIKIVNTAIHKIIYDRYDNAAAFANELSRAFTNLNSVGKEIAEKERWAVYRRLKFFEFFSDDQISEVTNVSEWFEVEAGEVVVTEGEVDNSFYVITRGTVEVVKGKQVIGTMGQGDCFGEMAYLTRRPRTASIVAKENAALMRVGSSLLQNASLETQLQYYKVFVETLVSRLSEKNVATAKNV
ncbi:MAG: protein kinase [Gammaproteobacteria bacterium]|nr:protein kinase [Gammaproteobacteria bacterium]